MRALLHLFSENILVNQVETIKFSGDVFSPLHKDHLFSKIIVVIKINFSHDFNLTYNRGANINHRIFDFNGYNLIKTPFVIGQEVNPIMLFVSEKNSISYGLYGI